MRGYEYSGRECRCPSSSSQYSKISYESIGLITISYQLWVSSPAPNLPVPLHLSGYMHLALGSAGRTQPLEQEKNKISIPVKQAKAACADGRHYHSPQND